jgi:hypothetical protein
MKDWIQNRLMKLVLVQGKLDLVVVSNATK